MWRMKCCSDVSSTGDCSPVWPNSDLLPPPDEQKKEKKKKKKIPGPRMENKEGEKTGQVLLIVCVYSPHHSIWFYFIEIFLFIDLTNAMFLTLFFFFFFLFNLGMIVISMFLVTRQKLYLTMLFVLHSLSFDPLHLGNQYKGSCTIMVSENVQRFHKLLSSGILSIYLFLFSPNS